MHSAVAAFPITEHDGVLMTATASALSAYFNKTLNVNEDPVGVRLLVFQCLCHMELAMTVSRPSS